MGNEKNADILNNTHIKCILAYCYHDISNRSGSLCTDVLQVYIMLFFSFSRYESIKLSHRNRKTEKQHYINLENISA